MAAAEAEERGGGSSRIESVIELETIGRLDWINRLNGQLGKGGNWVLKRNISRFC